MPAGRALAACSGDQYVAAAREATALISAATLLAGRLQQEGLPQVTASSASDSTSSSAAPNHALAKQSMLNQVWSQSRGVMHGTSQGPESSLDVLLSVQASLLAHTLLGGLLSQQGRPNAGAAADADTAVGGTTAHIDAALGTDPLLLVAALSLPGLSDLPWPSAPADGYGPASHPSMSWLLGIGLAAVARLEAGSEPVEAAAGARAEPAVEAAAGARAEPAVEAAAASTASQVGLGALRLQGPGLTWWSGGVVWRRPLCC